MLRKPPADPQLRQQQLLLRSTELRVALAHQAQALEGPLAVADQVRDGARWLYRHPEWPLGALALLALLRPRRALGLASRLWSRWNTFRWVLDWMKRGVT